MRTNRRKAPQRPAKGKSASRREGGSGMGTRLIIMLAVVAAVIFGVAIFFKVNRIEVQGNSIYSADDIIRASQIAVGDNLLTLNKPEAAGRIRAALPYVEDVSIGRSMPDTVMIEVKESSTAYAIATDTNTTWLINAVGKALEQIPSESAADYPQILGVTINSPTLGAVVSSSNQSALNAALDVIAAMDGTGVLEHLASVNVEKDYDIIVWYDEQYEIKLGGTDRLDYKIQYLGVILDSLSTYQAGTIDLSFSLSEDARFYSRQ